MKSVAVVDFSWLMHRNREALKMLSVTRQLPNGASLTIPTGHVYGTYQDVTNLSKVYTYVILAVDSPCHRRKQLMSGYKADRHTPTGDPLLDYNIYNDLIPLLKICTSIPNVFYVKEAEQEADDIIASFMLDSETNVERDYHIFMRDKDILQTAGRYSWHDKMTGKPINRNEYISKAAHIDDSFDYFPLAVKTITGDTSDNIPNVIPRFPKPQLNQVCHLVSRGDYTFDSILAALRQVSSEMNENWKHKLEELQNNDSELVSKLRKNFEMVYPQHTNIREFKYKQLGADVAEVNSILDSYSIQHS